MSAESSADPMELAFFDEALLRRIDASLDSIAGYLAELDRIASSLEQLVEMTKVRK